MPKIVLTPQTAESLDRCADTLGELSAELRAIAVSMRHDKIESLEITGDVLI